MGVRQETHYPWDGRVNVDSQHVDAPNRFTLHLRMPAWCGQWSLRVNGEPVNATWRMATSQSRASGTPGDRVELDMAMPVQAVYAHPRCGRCSGRIALQRGPLVYCLEGVDHDQTELERISIDPAKRRRSSRWCIDAGLLNGVTVIEVKARC